MLSLLLQRKICHYIVVWIPLVEDVLSLPEFLGLTLATLCLSGFTGSLAFTLEPRHLLAG